MVTITLTCRLHHEIEVNSEAFTVDVCTSDRINKLKDKIFAKLKEKKDDTFTNIEAYDMKLWKPSNDFIHVIIDSPTLKIENLTRKLNELRVGVNEDKEAAEGKDDKESSILITDKRSGCVVNDIKTVYAKSCSLVVTLVDNKNEKTEIKDWKSLEKWLLVKCKETQNVNLDIDKISFGNSPKIINIVRNGKVLGSIYSLKSQ
ncbi:hypothetical protein GLOIN_2v1780821 [Rhizophagus irregularis DAOM 181602=DAOM 197198]|uniref:Crinkler effector protein N-terminal domain-containing protein n=1 Tax=Rhizophagus irregularis (strain DAOM 181602 / DAOM 197198 / MUCL 43194) TaxID=747089 RepID=A0A2P4PLI0_RHIID|nr:hypothetical protein GLOIN_2v1780821 [Rhizophagus irregularis DAOM 181602=DAOM 197198]POG66238.1 hypothetical protein GLOIN_2v1780821 [Rhizophagus irregularis DAOM 181602=DAOM 197198]CAG8480955.1 12509_t:CDS:2 [Rhizophagus irregularis]|eukprot:XP_025173104.1 hypothetical protein GLOIN_2v1780821 [Rhizophagus irregularis DAOM 181602=DAOM 197198]